MKAGGCCLSSFRTPHSEFRTSKMLHFRVKPRFFGCELRTGGCGLKKIPVKPWRSWRLGGKMPLLKKCSKKLQKTFDSRLPFWDSHCTHGN
jgi:hypothetical protein